MTTKKRTGEAVTLTRRVILLNTLQDAVTASPVLSLVVISPSTQGTAYSCKREHKEGSQLEVIQLFYIVILQQARPALFYQDKHMQPDKLEVDHCQEFSETLYTTPCMESLKTVESTPHFPSTTCTWHDSTITTLDLSGDISYCISDSHLPPPTTTRKKERSSTLHFWFPSTTAAAMKNSLLLSLVPGRHHHLEEQHGIDILRLKLYYGWNLHITVYYFHVGDCSVEGLFLRPRCRCRCKQVCKNNPVTFIIQCS